MFVQQALNLLNSAHTDKLQSLLEFCQKFGAIPQVTSLKPKTYGLILTDCQESKEKILSYFEKNEAYDYKYLPNDLVITFKEYSSHYSFSYVGKFEPHYESFIEWALQNSVVVLLVESPENSYSEDW